MFKTIDYLQYGNKIQKQAYDTLTRLSIMENLSEFKPILCGTVPIGINIEGSDLDVIMEVYDFRKFEQKIRLLFSNKEKFNIRNTVINNTPVVIANFFFDGFEFELFGQPQVVKKQYAFLHMVIENYLINNYPTIREQVILLKKQGLKTEPAFCKVLGLEGNPYEELIDFGKQKGII